MLLFLSFGFWGFFFGGGTLCSKAERQEHIQVRLSMRLEDGKLINGGTVPSSGSL